MSSTPNLAVSEQDNGSSASTSKNDCEPKSDLKYAVCKGAWSGKAISLFNTWSAPDTNPERRLRLPSPDGKWTITVNGFHVRLRARGKQYWTPFGNMHDDEMGWAADSSRLFVTWSESGELGTWHVQVYDVKDGGLKEVKGVTIHARGDMLRRERSAPIPKWVTHVYRPMWDSLDYCEPDMIGSQWLNGSKEILVAAGAGPDSGCKYMAEWVVYRLDATRGDILETYTSSEAHRIFGDNDLPKLLEGEEDLLGVSQTTTSRTAHVFVALADNQHQGIIPVPSALGNGEDPKRNLYWGAAFGVRTYFRKNEDWKELTTFPKPKPYILERSVFEHPASGTILIADAYEGGEIKQPLTDFFQAAAGLNPEMISVASATSRQPVNVPSSADLVVYVGHDGLMDFPLPLEFPKAAGANRSAIILACASKTFFRELLRKTGAQPLLWTTGLMAPEAYTLKAAVDGWILEESKEQIRQRAAAAYSKYQKCSLAAAMRLFSDSW